MKTYRVWLLGEEYDIVADSHYKAKAQAARRFQDDHGKKFKWSTLLTLARAKRIDSYDEKLIREVFG